MKTMNPGLQQLWGMGGGELGRERGRERRADLRMSANCLAVDLVSEEGPSVTFMGEIIA